MFGYEHWLATFHLLKLGNITENYTTYCCSAGMAEIITTGVLRSLPFGGMVSCDINSLACRMKMREKKERYILKPNIYLLINLYLQCFQSRTISSWHICYRRPTVGDHGLITVKVDFLTEPVHKLALLSAISSKILLCPRFLQVLLLYRNRNYCMLLRFAYLHLTLDHSKVKVNVMLVSTEHI